MLMHPNRKEGIGRYSMLRELTVEVLLCFICMKGPNESGQTCWRFEKRRKGVKWLSRKMEG